MIKNQEFIEENDGKGTVRLIIQVDPTAAIEEAKAATENGGRIKTGNVEWIDLGSFPQEMWAYDPWLIEARKAASAGDMGECNRLMQKFFEVHKCFKTIARKKYW